MRCICHSHEIPLTAVKKCAVLRKGTRTSLRNPYLCFRKANRLCVDQMHGWAIMGYMKVGPFFILVLFIFNVAHSQSQRGQSGALAHSSLTVTATVEPSVWLVMKPDGKQEVVVANAPDPKASFHHPPMPKQVRPWKSAKASAVPATRRHQPGDQREAAVVYSFPTIPRQFEVTQQTTIMSITDGAKTERQAVQLITVVAR